MRLFINAPYLPILSKANFLYTSHRSLYNPDKPGIEQGKVKHRKCYMYECLSCKSIPFLSSILTAIKKRSIVQSIIQSLHLSPQVEMWVDLFPMDMPLPRLQVSDGYTAGYSNIGYIAVRFPGILILVQSITTLYFF